LQKLVASLVKIYLHPQVFYTALRCISLVGFVVTTYWYSLPTYWYSLQLTYS